MQDTNYLIVLIFECVQNMEIGMNRYTAFVSKIAGIPPFIRVKECWLGVIVGWLSSGEVSSFIRYIAESLHKAWGLLTNITEPEEIFSLEKYNYCDVLIVETGLDITHSLNFALKMFSGNCKFFQKSLYTQLHVLILTANY